MSQASKRLKVLGRNKCKSVSNCRIPQSLPEHQSPQPLICPIPIPTPQLTLQDLPTLHFISIFMNKIIVMYCNRLHCFVYFDQHAVHERIRYQFYIQKAWKQMGKDNGRFVDIDLKVIEKIRSKPRNVFTPKKILKKIKIGEKQLENAWGFMFVTQQQTRFLVECPQIFNTVLNDDQIDQIVQHLTKSQLPKIIDQIIANTSCKGAVKFNEDITQQQAVQLIKTLQLCEYPFFCVHGRTSVYLVPH